MKIHGVASAREEHPTQSEMEADLVCPTCHSTLDESDSPVARQMKAYIRQRIADGATKSQIVDELVGPHQRSSFIERAVSVRLSERTSDPEDLWAPERALWAREPR